jgi:hypothetical protein
MDSVVNYYDGPFVQASVRVTDNRKYTRIQQNVSNLRKIQISKVL